MNSLPMSIEAFAATQPEGAVLTAKSLLHMGKRAAIDQALARLAKQGRLLRVGRGAYAAPVAGRFGARPPSPEKVVASLADVFGETVVPHGGASANRLGLTTQVPVKPVFLTSGRSRRIRLGKLEVSLRKAGSRALALGTSRTGETVRALEWLGRDHAPAALVRLASSLGPAERSDLLMARSLMPGWLAAQVSRTLRDA